MLVVSDQFKAGKDTRQKSHKSSEMKLNETKTLILIYIHTSFNDIR